MSTKGGRSFAPLRKVFQPEDPEEALCRQSDPDAWFSEADANNRAAHRVCQNCAIRIECLIWAVTHNEPEGIWGGMGVDERKRWAASRRRRGLPITVEALYAEEDATDAVGDVA